MRVVAPCAITPFRHTLYPAYYWFSSRHTHSPSLTTAWIFLLRLACLFLPFRFIFIHYLPVNVPLTTVRPPASLTSDCGVSAHELSNYSLLIPPPSSSYHPSYYLPRHDLPYLSSFLPAFAVVLLRPCCSESDTFRSLYYSLADRKSVV